jgi:hypothetical protein
MELLEVYMVSNLDVYVGLQTDDAKAEIINLRYALDETARQAKKVRDDVKVTVNDALGALQTTVRLFSNVYTAIGGTMDPLQEAMLQAVSSTITVMMSTASAYLALPGAGWIIAAGIGVAMMFFQASANIAAEKGMDGARTQLNAATAALGNLQSLLTIGGRIF